MTGQEICIQDGRQRTDSVIMRKMVNGSKDGKRLEDNITILDPIMLWQEIRS